MDSLRIIDLGPRDDLESLAYTAFSLLRGDLPWRTSSSRNESIKNKMKCIFASKSTSCGYNLCASFPTEFGYLLQYSRRLEYDELPGYAELETWFNGPNGRLGGKDAGGPLDWGSAGRCIPEERNDSETAQNEDGTE